MNVCKTQSKPQRKLERSGEAGHAHENFRKKRGSSRLFDPMKKTVLKDTPPFILYTVRARNDQDLKAGMEVVVVPLKSMIRTQASELSGACGCRGCQPEKKGSQKLLTPLLFVSLYTPHVSQVQYRSQRTP